jgi:hypothetical protein
LKMFSLILDGGLWDPWSWSSRTQRGFIRPLFSCSLRTES